VQASKIATEFLRRSSEQGLVLRNTTPPVQAQILRGDPHPITDGVRNACGNNEVLPAGRFQNALHCQRVVRRIAPVHARGERPQSQFRRAIEPMSNQAFDNALRNKSRPAPGGFVVVENAA